MQPEITKLRVVCDESRGVLTYQYSYGYCTQNADPMFCRSGCYTCPIYANTVCTANTSGELRVGALVEVLEDSNLLTGNRVVGRVNAGDQFRVAQIQRQWVNMQKVDGTAVDGWIEKTKLKVLLPD